MAKLPLSKPSVVSGVVAGIIVLIFIEPVLNLTWPLILWLGELLYEGIIDAIYRSAALGQRNHLSLFILTIIFSIFAGILMGGLTRMYRERQNLREPSIKSKTMLRVAFIINALLFFIVSILVLGIHFAELQYMTSFQQRLTVIAPVISNQRYEELKAQWAVMKNRNDYLAVNTELENIALRFSIELPKPLLK